MLRRSHDDMSREVLYRTAVLAGNSISPIRLCLGRSSPDIDRIEGSSRSIGSNIPDPCVASTGLLTGVYLRSRVVATTARLYSAGITIVIIIIIIIIIKVFQTISASSRNRSPVIGCQSPRQTPNGLRTSPRKIHQSQHSDKPETPPAR